jgi:hypothetical protein
MLSHGKAVETAKKSASRIQPMTIEEEVGRIELHHFSCAETHLAGSLRR